MSSFVTKFSGCPVDVALSALQDEWRHLLAGGMHVVKEMANPASDWLSDRSWKEVLMLSVLPIFNKFSYDFCKNLHEYKAIFDSTEPHRYGGTNASKRQTSRIYFLYNLFRTQSTVYINIIIW